MAKTDPLTKAQSDLIAAAVAEAEAKTSGEIVCLVTDEVSDYREVPLAWAAGVALIVPPLAFLAGIQPLSLQEALGGWSVGHDVGAELRLSFAITLYAAAQAGLFAAMVLIASIPSVRRRLTPGRLKDKKVERAAFEHFIGRGREPRAAVKGVEIFASIQDRRIQIIADDVVHAQVGQAAWDEVIQAAVAEMRERGPAEGLALAVRVCGELLARYFPEDGGPNKLSDRPVIL